MKNQSIEWIFFCFHASNFVKINTENFWTLCIKFVNFNGDSLAQSWEIESDRTNIQTSLIQLILCGSIARFSDNKFDQDTKNEEGNPNSKSSKVRSNSGWNFIWDPKTSNSGNCFNDKVWMSHSYELWRIVRKNLISKLNKFIVKKKKKKLSKCLVAGT